MFAKNKVVDIKISVLDKHTLSYQYTSEVLNWYIHTTKTVGQNVYALLLTHSFDQFKFIVFVQCHKPNYT